jgi:hypothetical protein
MKEPIDMFRIGYKAILPYVVWPKAKLQKPSLRTPSIGIKIATTAAGVGQGYLV